MRVERANPAAEKGWYAGAWNSDLPVSIGYAAVGIDEPHLHELVTEIYLIARGSSVMRIGQETVPLAAGDMVIVEPGEAHTFLESSPDYFHFVAHVPGISGEAARKEKRAVPREELGL